MKYLLSLFLTLTGATLWAQDYLVTTRQDTVRGKLSIISFDKTDNVTVAVNKKKKDYPAYSILRAYIDSTTFIPVRRPEAFRMMRLERSGMVSLCYARQAPGTPYNIPHLLKRTGESMEVGAIRFKKSVAKFLEECASIKQKVESDELGRNDLDKIVESYNRCLEQQSTIAFVDSEDPKLSALNTFNQKLEKDEKIPSDAKEILKDLYTKVKSGKPVPNYLADGLRQALKDFPAYQEDCEKLLTVLKN